MILVFQLLYTFIRTIIHTLGIRFEQIKLLYNEQSLHTIYYN